MSIRLIIQEYLGLLKESKELDDLLPILLSSMNLVNISGAQRGARQYGVDLAAVGRDDDGKRKLFLFVVKCGDITRSTWKSGPQAIRPSLEEIKDVYLPTHVAPEHAKLPKKVVVVTNGELRQELQLTYSQYCSQWISQTKTELATWVGTTLAELTERHLLDEFVFPGVGRSELRRALSTLDNPALSVEHFESFFQSFCDVGRLQGLSKTRMKKEVVKTLRACALGLAIYCRWAEKTEGNLLPALLASERAVLLAWAFLRKSQCLGEKESLKAYARVFVAMLQVAGAYVLKITPYYATDHGFASIYHDNIFVNEVVFEELGKLGLFGSIWSMLREADDSELAKQETDRYVELLKALLNTHSISNGPCYDNHAIDVALAMLLLIRTGNRALAKEWLNRLINRVGLGRKFKRHFPVDTDSFDDLIAVRLTGEMEPDKVATMSTLIPLLAQLCAVLDSQADYDNLKKNLLPLFSGTTLQVWFPDSKFEELLVGGKAHRESGVTLAPYEIPDSFDSYKSTALTLPPAVASMSGFDFAKKGVQWLPLVFCRHYRCPAPIWYFNPNQVPSVHG